MSSNPSDDNYWMQTLRDLFAKTLAVSPDSITSSTSMDNFKEWDSLYHIDLMINIEKKFNIKFDTHDLVKLDSIEKIIGRLKEFQR